MSRLVYVNRMAEDAEVLADCGPGARIIEFAVGPVSCGWTPQVTRSEAEMIIRLLGRTLEEGYIP